MPFRCSRLIPCMLLATLPWGCGGTDTVASGDMEGGTMRVIAVEPLGDSQQGNFIGNGDFGMWWAGAPAPEGFIPPGGGFSTVSRVADGIQQRWQRSDLDAEQRHALRVSASGLKPETEYTFLVLARRITSGQLELRLVEERPGGDGAPLLDGAALEIAAPVGITKYHRVDFKTELGGVVNVLAQGEGGAEVIWYEWVIQ